MTDKPKDYTGTLLRMAGDIAAGFVQRADFREPEWKVGVAHDSLHIAREILRLATEETK